jgi:hypothetical protein
MAAIAGAMQNRKSAPRKKHLTPVGSRQEWIKISDSSKVPSTWKERLGSGNKQYRGIQIMGRGILLWMLGVPLPIILLLAMCSHH